MSGGNGSDGSFVLFTCMDWAVCFGMGHLVSTCLYTWSALGSVSGRFVQRGFGLHCTR